MAFLRYTHLGQHYLVVPASTVPQLTGGSSPQAEGISSQEAELLLRAMARTDPQLLSSIQGEPSPSWSGPRGGRSLRHPAGISGLEPPMSIAGLRNGHGPLTILRDTYRPPAMRREPEPSEASKEVAAARALPKHFIAIQTVDASGNNVPAIKCQIVLADGFDRTLVTDEEGYGRIDRVPAGSGQIRLPEVDGKSWRPATGASPYLVNDKTKYTSHKVQRGECLSKICVRYGAGHWNRVWQDPKNEELRNKRKSPHILRPGDVVMVPSASVYEIVRETNATHRIIVDVPMPEFRVVLQDHNQQPFKNLPYELWIDVKKGAPQRTGTTDGDGKVIQKLPAKTNKVHVYVPDLGVTWTFALGALNPLPKNEAELQSASAEERKLMIEAAQSRLNLMGFPCGQASGSENRDTHAALALSKSRKHSAAHKGEPLAHADYAHLDDLFEGKA